MSDAPDTITELQHEVLVAIARGTPYTMWPMMRQALRRRGLIRAIGGPAPPADIRHAKQPVRKYELTQLGLDAIASYAGPTRPHHEIYPKICFLKA